MKNQKFKLSFTTLICVVTAFCACGQTTKKDDGFKYGNPKHGLALGIKINIEEFNFDSTLVHIITAVIRTKNVSDKKVRIGYLPNQNSCTFSVIDSFGEEIPKTRYQKGLDNLPLMRSMGIAGSSIYPEDFSERAFILSKRFDFSSVGTYTVQYTRKVSIAESGKIVSFDISSPKVTFSTIPPKPAEDKEKKRNQEKYSVL